MKVIQRQSAVHFAAEVREEEARDDWKVVLHYQNEGKGPWLVDLAHKRRFDLQDKGIDGRSIGSVTMPANPGESSFTDGILVNRMNATQASVYCLGDGASCVDDDGACTDVSEASVFLALFGPEVFSLAEKLSALDFPAPEKKPPFLYQGPFCRVPCQIVVLEKGADGAGGFLLACSRGYAQSMVEAILHAGEEFGLRPAGEQRFTGWLRECGFC